MTRPKIVDYDPRIIYRYAHLKRDGIWIHMIPVCGDPDGVQILTRHPTDITGALLGHPIVVAFEQRSLYTELYCELFAPGQPASYVKHALAEGKLDELRIEAFASPSLGRDVYLEYIEQVARDVGVPFANYVRNHDGLALCKAWERDPDCEGIVFKDGNLLNWAKWKPVRTSDLILTGYVDGKGKYLGLVGALELSLFDGTLVCRCSGMDDATRILVSDEGQSYLGRVVEVAYQYVGSQGGLRHPRFVRFRDDKRPEECVSI